MAAAKRDASSFKIDNLVFIFVMIFVVILLFTNPAISDFIIDIGQTGGPIAPFIAGAFYSEALTSPAATVTLFYMGKIYNPILIALVGALGSAFSDFLLYRFLRKRASQSVEYLARHFRTRYKSTKKTIRILVLITASLILASPLPDELGIAMLSAINISVKKMFLISYMMSFLGILTIAWLGSAL